MMTLRSPHWNTNQRVQNAADNNRPMRPLEPDKVAVTLLQRALVSTGIATIKDDGLFGPNTAKGVVTVETRFNMDRDEGVAGRQTLGILDILLQGGQLGHQLALTDVSLAAAKIRAAIQALQRFRSDRNRGRTGASLTIDALRTHFRLEIAPPTIGAGRQITDADLTNLLSHYNQIARVFGRSPTSFSTGVPVNGIFTAAEAPVGGPIRFGPAFTNVDSHFGGRIGPNSRAAVLIHEAVHVFDAASGSDSTHISEFDPAYARQPANQSLHNPSSYAGFAAHVHLRRDPSPRFGLGPGARGL